MPIYLPPLTRRRFLAGSLAAGAGVLLNASLPAAETPADPNRWALLSDTHVWEKRDGSRRGTKPAVTFAQAVDEILALAPRPAGAILSGDCVYLEGQAGDYTVLADLVKPLRAAGIPLHLLLGNHDHRENFWTAFPEAKSAQPPVPDKHVAAIETPRADWLLLDSLEKTAKTPGLFGEAQLAWLSKTLDTRPGTPALVVGHHNLSGLGGLRDTEGFLKVVAARVRAKAYFFGHTHEWSVSEKHGIQLVNVPATAWLFAPAEPRGWLDVALREDGAVLTLHALDKKHPKHGQRVELTWRKEDRPAR